MAAVYPSAYLTIAASLAADFSTRETTTHFAGFLNDAAESRNYSVYVRGSFSHDEFSTDNTGTATVSNPLLGRTWTFQQLRAFFILDELNSCGSVELPRLRVRQVCRYVL